MAWVQSTDDIFLWGMKTYPKGYSWKKTNERFCKKLHERWLWRESEDFDSISALIIAITVNKDFYSHFNQVIK